MRRLSLVVVTVAAVLSSTCAKRVPEPVGIAPGTPHISWIIMSGDGDNPDAEFVCQSTPRSECVVPVSRPDAQVFAHVHFYYHGAGTETRYEGPIDIGFFQGSAPTRTVQTTIAVRKTESITNQSVSGIVTSTPGTYAVTFDLVAKMAGVSQGLPIRESVQVIVK
jgi:hypothetical protein